MKLLIILAIVVILLIGGFFFFSNSLDNSSSVNNENEDREISGGTYKIDIKDFSFVIKELKIKKGETVVWTNKDDAKHTVTSDSGNELNSRLLSKEEIYSHTFNTAGEFSYHCTPHPYMKAKIIVE